MSISDSRFKELIDNSIDKVGINDTKRKEIIEWLASELHADYATDAPVITLRKNLKQNINAILNDWEKDENQES